MFRLEISVDGVACEELDVSRDRITLGRRAECDIQLLDPTVSGQHAMITETLGDIWIEDLGSTNGTYVNDALIRRHLLRDGDLVEIGKHQLLCRTSAEKVPESDSLQGMMSSPVVPTRSDELDAAHLESLAHLERTMRRMPEGGEVPMAWIEIRSGPHAGRRLKLDQDSFSLGAARNQLAVVARQPTGYYLLPTVDAETTHKSDYPHVNGEPVTADGCPLFHRDQLDVGGIQMEFMFDSRP